MKTKFILVLLFVGALLQGCIVKSVHPFYSESDVLFKESFLHTWVDQDSRRWTINRVKEKPNAYEMRCNKDGKDAVFVAHLFKLENELYLDFLPLASDNEGLTIFDLHLLPTHSVGRVEIINDRELQIKWFNEEWLTSLFNDNKIKISHETIPDFNDKEKNNYYVLTASTQELQKFIIKYGHEDAAFDDNDTMWLRLKRVL
jgi:hypothetical protein